MTARNLTALLRLALCLALALASASCSLLSSGEPETQQTERKQLSVEEARKAVDAAKQKLVSPEDLEQAKDQAGSERSKAKQLRGIADQKSEDTRKRATKNDPNDPKQAPITYKAIQDANAAEASASEKEGKYSALLTQNQNAQKELSQAQTDLANAQQPGTTASPKPTSTVDPKPAEPDSSSFYLSLVSVVLSLFTLGLLITAFLMIPKRWKASQQGVSERFHVLKNKQDEVLRGLGPLTNELTDARTRLSNIQDDVRKVVAQVARLEPPPQYDPRRDPRSFTPPEAPFEEPVKALTFPISASSILARLDGQEPTITLDPLRNILRRDFDGKGELVLIQDPQAPSGSSFVVPNTTRFQAREDFYNHYKQFYECDVPKAGELWVNRPALVMRVGDSWQLQEKGTLEIK
jgi:chemotaxis protein histidine kinase CheA